MRHRWADHVVCIVLGVCLVVPGLAAAKDEPPIIRHGETQIFIFDVRQAVNTQVPSDSQFQLYGSEKKLREFIGSMFVRAKLAEYARQRELTDEEQWRVDEAMRRIYSQIEIERQVEARGPSDYDVFVREMYLATPDRFRVPEAVNARHILVSTESRSDEEALKRLEDARGRLIAGDAFEAIAEEYSDDPSVERNKGELGFFTAGKMVKPFEDAAFSLEEPGELSDPVKTQFGYHLIQLIEKRPAKQQTFEEAKPALERDERSSFRGEVVNELIANISALEGVEIDNDVLMSLIQRIEDLPRR